MKKLAYSLIFICIFCCSNAYSANRFWISGVASNWNNTANWSATSGGVGGVSVPVNTDIAIFNGFGLGSCNIDIAANVLGFSMVAGYTGSITFNAAINLTVGASNYSQAAGTFTGNNGTITINGNFGLSGGTFTSTTGTMSITGGYTFSAGTFNHNNGTVSFSGTQTFSGNITMYNIIFAASGSDYNITAGQFLTSTNNVTITGASWYRINTGTLEMQGNMTLTSSSNNSANGGSATYLFDGAGTQNINATAITTYNYVCALGKVQINKLSGALNLSGIINFNGATWVNTAGASLVNPGTSSLNILNTTTFSGQDLTLYDIYIPATGQDINITSGQKLTSTNAVTINGSSWYRINTGILEIKGDLNLTSSSNNSANGGSATYLFDGSGSQNITSGAIAYNYVTSLGNVQVNKASGSLNLIGIINFNGTTWNTLAGTSLINAGTSTFNILNTTTFSGQDLTLFDIYIPATGQDINIAAGQKLTSTDLVTISGSSWYRINTGIFEIQGNLSLTASSNNSANGGSATYLFNGTGIQKVTSLAVAYNYVAALGNVQVNKVSGALNLVGIINFNGTTWNTIAGTTLINAGTSTLNILNTTTFSGQDLTLYDIFIPATGQDINISSGVKLTSINLITINGSSWYRINTGILEIKGNLNLTASSNNSANGGSATYLFNGTGLQNVTSSAVAYNYVVALGNVQVNKTSGSLNLIGIINFNGTTWNTVAGTTLINPGTSTLNILNTTTFSGQNLSLYNIYIPASGQDINLSSGLILTSTNNVTINGSSWYRINTGTLEIKGDLTLTASSNNSANGGSATYLFDGTSNQNIDGSAISTLNYICALGKVQINKISGALNLLGIINFNGVSWITTAGTSFINAGTSTVDILNTTTFSGQNLSLYNIYIPANGQDINISSGLVITSTNNVTINGSSWYRINTGTLEIKGDLTLTASSNNSANGGSATFLFDGTGTQTIDASSISTYNYICALPNVQINKSTGTLNLIGIINFNGATWTTTAGNTLIDPGTSAVDILSTCNLSGQNIILYDIYVAGTSQTITISSGVMWTSTRLITLAGSSWYAINTGTFNPKGDVTITNSSTSTGGTGTFLFDGTSNQLLTGSGSSNRGRLPKVNINKTGGILTFGSNLISEMNNWTYIQGTVDATTNSSLVEFTGSLILNGQGSSATMKFYDIQTISATTTLGGNLDIGNDLQMISGALDVSTTLYPITIQGNWIQNYNNVNAFTERTGTVTFNGTAAQTIFNNAISAGEVFYNLVINNAAGVTLSGTTNYNVNISGTAVGLNLLNGLLTTSSSNLIVINSGAVSIGSSTSSYVNGPCRKIGNQAFIFPLGKSGRYARLALGVPTVSSTFTAEYFATPYSNTTSMAATPTPVLTNVSTQEYWQLDRTGTGNATVTLYWEDAAWSGIIDCTTTDLRIAHWNGSAWENNNDAVTTTGSCVGSAAGTVKTTANVTSFSPFTFGSRLGVNPLPIELLLFTAIPNGNNVYVKWTTASEQNNDFFTIEKTKDGSQFETVATIDGAGNSTSVLNYSAVDANPFSGISYYRLKQTDLDGLSSYSSLVSVEFNNNTEFGFDLYPNPNDGDNINIVFTSLNQEIIIVLYDVTGKEVYSKLIVTEGKGNTIVSVNSTQKLAQGVYIISATSRDNTCKKKLIVK